MKTRLLDHLVCPLDKTPLQLKAFETIARSLPAEQMARAQQLGIDPVRLSEEVQSGVLINTARKIVYPIYQGVPRLLTFRTRVADVFWEKFGDQVVRELPGFSLPREQSMPGEANVLRTFSSEWVNYDWDGQSYWNLKPDAWFQCMRFAVGVDRWPIAGKLALEVGMGIGGVADYMVREEKCEMVGMDLGYAVDVGYRHFGANPFLHIVQASAFLPPFREQSFDFVYSFGVIHHTFSTKTAFDCISKLPRKGGRLYVWVYSPSNESRTLVRRGLMMVERAIRPTVSHLPEGLQTVALAPLVPLYMGYQAVRRLRGSEAYVHYGMREALHAARDRFTPHYIHRHSDEEVSAWFRAAHYDDLECNSQRERPDFVPIAFTSNTGVIGTRQ